MYLLDFALALLTRLTSMAAGRETETAVPRSMPDSRVRTHERWLGVFVFAPGGFDGEAWKY